jgi:hypothetical protein
LRQIQAGRSLVEAAEFDNRDKSFQQFDVHFGRGAVSASPL